jgi:hypothetical protein
MKEVQINGCGCYTVIEDGIKTVFLCLAHKVQDIDTKGLEDMQEWVNKLNNLIRGK